MTTAPSIAAPTRRSIPNLLLNGGLVIAAAVFLWQMPYYSRGGGDAFLINVWYHGFVFVWLLLLTALGRTLPLRVLATSFFLGLFVSIAVALAIGFPLGDALGTRSRLFDSILVPGLEEAVKALPILLFFWFLTRRSTWQPSMTDGLLMGFLVGAGFALHEDAMFDRSFGSGFAISDLTFIFPTIDDERLIGEGRDFGFYHSQWTRPDRPVDRRRLLLPPAVPPGVAHSGRGPCRGLAGSCARELHRRGARRRHPWRPGLRTARDADTRRAPTRLSAAGRHRRGDRDGGGRAPQDRAGGTTCSRASRSVTLLSWLRGAAASAGSAASPGRSRVRPGSAGRPLRAVGSSVPPRCRADLVTSDGPDAS